MQIRQTLQFKKSYKKLHASQRHALNAQLKIIIDAPKIGEQKKGDLSWLRVHKCKIINQLTLIGYRLEETELVLTFVAIGSHENFYRDLRD